MPQVFDRWDPAGYDPSNELIAGNVGGLAGAGAGALAGAAATSWSGPGALVGALIGGAAGGLGGQLSGFGNKTWTLKDDGNGNLSFSPEEGEYVRYNNSSGANKDLVDHMFWNKITGDVYYMDPDSGKYTKLDTNGLDMSGGMLSFASDDLLDAASDRIATTIKGNRSNKALKEALAFSVLPEGLGLASVAIGTPNSPDSIQMREYEKRKMDAEALLQKMITEDLNTPSAEDNSVYYKYGPDELDLKYYLHNIGSNLQSYLQSLDWSLALKNAFMNSYNSYKNALQELLDTNSGRFFTDDAGMILDSQNLLNNQGTLVIDENGTVYNSYDEIPDKKLRKTAVEFSPNLEVTNYLNTIGLAIVGAGKTRKSSSAFSGDFDMNKHGFVNYWLNKINPAGGEPDIDPYLALDPVDPTGKRARTNRTRYLANQLQNYLRKILGSKTNFDNSSFKSKDAYIQKVLEAIDNLNNGWDETDPAALLAIGITPDFYSALMTDKSNPLMSEAEIAAEMELQKAQAASDYIEKLKGVYDNYAAQSHTITEDKAVGYVRDARYDITSPGAELRIGTALANLGYAVDPALPESVTIAAEELWSAVKAALSSGSPTVKTRSGDKDLLEILPIILPLYSAMFKESTTNPGVKFLDDPDHDRQYGAILCLKNGKLYYDFIGNVKESSSWLQLKGEFNKNYVAPQEKSGPKFSFDKLGGVLRKLQEGGNLNPAEFDEETLAQLQQLQEMATALPAQPSSISDYISLGMTPGLALALSLYGGRQDAAKAKGLSLSRYNQKSRTPNGKPDFFNQESGQWKTEDYARLGAIAADIASIPLPSVSGAAVGLGGTMMNLWADWADDSVTTTELIKNLGANLGMDALSIIPVVGDVADAGRLTRNLVKMAPKIGYALSTYGILATLKNGDNIMESLGKVMSDEKLTVGDYQNIAQGIAALSGINGGIKAGVAKRIAKNRAKVTAASGTDAIGITLKDKTGNVQDYIFNGNKATELKELIAKGVTKENIDAINSKIQSFEGFKDLEINTRLNTIPVGVGLPIGRTTGADGKKSWGVKNPFSTEKHFDTFEIYDPSKLRGGYASQNLLSTGRQNAVRGSNRDVTPYTEAEIAELTKKAVELGAKDSGAIAARDKVIGMREKTQGRIDEITTKQNELVATEGYKLATSEGNAIRADIDRLKLKYGVASTGDIRGDLRSKVEAALPSVKTVDDATAAITRIESKINIEKAALASELTKLAKALASGKTALAKKALNNINTIESNISSLLNLKSDLTTWKGDKEILDKIDALLYNPTDNSYFSLAEANFRKDLAKYNKELGILNDRLKKMNTTTNADGTPRQTTALKNFLATLGPGQTMSVAGKNRDVSLIIKDLGLLKQGGRLQFLKEGNVLKALSGVQLKNNNGWYDDIFKGYELTILDRIKSNRDYYKTINDKLKEHYGLYSDANASGDWTKRAYTGKNNSVGNYQTWYNGEGFNQLGIDNGFKNNRYGFNPNTRRISKDRSGVYQSDNLYSSITDDRRVLGRLGDWSDNQISDFNNKLKLYNLQMQLGHGNYYYLNPITEPNPSPNPGPTTPTPVGPSGSEPIMIGGNSTPTPNPNLSGSEPSLLTIPQGDSPLGNGEKGSGKLNGPGGPKNGFGNIQKALPDIIRGLRFKWLTDTNRKNRDLAIGAEIPYLLDPNWHYVPVERSYGDEVQGHRIYGSYTSEGNKGITSDMQHQMAYAASLRDKGAELMKPYMDRSQARMELTQEANRLLEKENSNMEHMVALLNRLSEIQSLQNIAKHKQAFNSQYANDRDLLAQEILAETKTANAKAKAASLERIMAAVQNNPNGYGAGLSDKELSVYNRAMSGISPSSMSTDEQAILGLARSKINMAMKNQYYELEGIPADKWTEDANRIRSYKPQSTFTPTLIDIAKDGTKLRIAKIRNKAKNADRFLKSIQKLIESLDKKLDRISKSMYGLPKVEVVKPK